MAALAPPWLAGDTDFAGGITIEFPGTISFQVVVSVIAGARAFNLAIVAAIVASVDVVLAGPDRAAWSFS